VRGRGRKIKDFLLALLVIVLAATFIITSPFEGIYPAFLPPARAQTVTAVGSISPASNGLLIGSSGNVRVNIPVSGIAVRIEIPREFLQGVVFGENDTHFITSNIRNDYYYYNVVDESAHWTYDWQDNASDGACFKPNFSYHDPNAPYCVEIWNYLNSPRFLQPDRTVLCYASGTPYDSALPCPPTYFSNHVFDYTYLVGKDYCQTANVGKYVFGCFSAPRFVLFSNLKSPSLAGDYNFTLEVTNRTNILGYPDFVHAWKTPLYVPASMTYNAGFIAGNVCDAGTARSGKCNTVTGPVSGEGIVYALNETSGVIVARAYLDQPSVCASASVGCGFFNLTGLAPGDYEIEGSAGVNLGPINHNLTYSLTPCCSGGPPFPTATIYVPPNGNPGITTLPLRRAPIVCGTITYETPGGAPINSLSRNPYLIAAGFNRILPNGKKFGLNVTVEGTDPAGHIFRFTGISTDSSSDSFELLTGANVTYAGTDPYGTEFAGLPAPEDLGPGGYTVTVRVWVSGYIQFGGFPTVQLLQSPGQTTPSCPTLGQSVSVIMHMGGIITGSFRFMNSPQNLESPFAAEASLPITPRPPIPDALFGGNIVIQAYDQSGFLRGVTVVYGTGPDGSTQYASAICQALDSTGHCAIVRFYIIGFTEYYNHTLSGTWEEHDYGLADGTYSLQAYVRGYELTSTGPEAVSINNGSNGTVSVDMTRGGAFEVSVNSYDNRFGSRAVQAMLQWRFLNSSVPVWARVYFYNSGGLTVGYVDALMETGSSNALGVISFTSDSFEVIFAGQNWSLREIWFYGYIPTHITNDTYTIKAYTLGYVRQFAGGVNAANSLVGFSQVYIALFYANEVDLTLPLFANLQAFTQTTQYNNSIGQVFSIGLTGAEMLNGNTSMTTLVFNIYGFGGMQLNQALCQTDVFLRGVQEICGQGHFFYHAPDGTLYFDYGLDVGNYTSQVPEFGFTVHFLQPWGSPVVSFTDLFLQAGVVVRAIQMGLIMQGPGSSVSGYNTQPTCFIQLCVVPLSWAQVTASNSTYSRSVPTLDGTYDGVDALFLPAGTYNVTFSDLQYQSQSVTNFSVGWGGSYSLLPPQQYLCPIGIMC